MAMNNKLGIIIVFLLLAIPSCGQSVAAYNPVWNTPSAESHESMPCGGGSVGMNVWVEQGDLYFYFARSGTFDANNGFLKGGRVKIHLTPNPFDADNFRQELKLKDGYIEIIAGKERTRIEIWADVFRPFIHAEVKSNRPVGMEVSYESWRYKDRLIRTNESHFNSYKSIPPAGLCTAKDSIRFTAGQVEFYHRNPERTVFDVTVERQGLNAVKQEMTNPLKHLTFGGRLYGSNLIESGTYTDIYAGTDFKGWTLKSARPATTHTISLALTTVQSENLVDWHAQLQQSIAQARADKKARQNTRQWWHSFWERSFIHINSSQPGSVPWKVARNYQLFRYMLGCNAYGSAPTKFNGGLFTFDPVHVDSTRAFTPDFRLWGGGTMTAQNQRLVYFPLLKSGDFDMMKPQFDFYNRMLGNAKLRTKVYWNHPGACFSEQIEHFGLPNLAEYDWQPRRSGFPIGVDSNPWLEYTWDTALEFALMMLDAHLYNDEPIAPHLPFIESTLTFFDEHYRYLALKRGTQELDGNGHLVLYPGSGCETYKMTTNAASTIAALKVVAEKLLQLPDLSTVQRSHWTAVLNCIPPIPFRECEGRITISPAKTWERINNSEVPSLYPVFPWRIYGMGKPGLQIAIDTYLYDPEAIKFRSHIGWKQDNIFAACLGLTEEAERLTLQKLSDGPYRFPAFWGPGFDWTPDHNWGGSGMIGLQEMLLQTNGDSILLFPAWPAHWDVHLKLHAPRKTTVEVVLRNGKIEWIKVLPQTRAKDVVVCIPQ